jgi:hypothetical protein
MQRRNTICFTVGSPERKIKSTKTQKHAIIQTLHRTVRNKAMKIENNRTPSPHFVRKVERQVLERISRQIALIGRNLSPKINLPSGALPPELFSCFIRVILSEQYVRKI